MTIRFMSRIEIAEHLGVALATVKGYVNFPDPDVVVGRNQGWAQATVDAWAQARTDKAAERALAVALKAGPVADDFADEAPASLGPAAVGGAGTERAQRIGSDVDLTRTQVDRRGRGGF